MLKAQLHIHIKGDPSDNIRHTWRELIDHAKKLDFNVLAITCHKRIIFPAKAISYAKKRNILLIKGIEIEIGKSGQHVLILNPHISAEKIRTFADLAKYKTAHLESMIIAPHPYFPTRRTLKNNLEKHIDLFDAIEYNYFVTKSKNYNKKAIQIAKKYKKPLIGTSDCHVLKYLNTTYSLIDCPTEKNSLPNQQAILNAIRKNAITIKTNPLSHFTATKILLILLWQELSKKIFVV